MGLSVCMLRGNKSTASKALTAPLREQALGVEEAIPSEGIYIPVTNVCGSPPTVHRLSHLQTLPRQKIIHIYMNTCT